MKVALTGADGLLGSELAAVLKDGGYDLAPILERDVDIVDAAAVRAGLRDIAPELLIHCASYTRVDSAESDIDRVYAVNAFGTFHLARTAAELDCRFVYISTDYVFDGALDRPYRPEDEPAPLNVYGRSKLAGEMLVRTYAPSWTIIRSSSLYGHNGNGFPEKLCRRAVGGGELRVVDDQISSPTYAPELARGIVELLEAAEGGVYHLTNTGAVSWYEFARVLAEELGLPNELTPVSSSEFDAPARRPAYSALDNTAARELGVELRPWRSALREYLEREAEELRPLAGLPSGGEGS